MMRHTKLILGFGLITALLGLAGCGGKIRYPNYYVLNVPAPPPANNGLTPVLGSVTVREFDAPRFLKEGPIAYRPSPEQLEFYDYHHWAEDPRRVITKAMVREMQAREIFRSVDVFDGRGTPEYLVTGTLDHLEEVDQGSNVSIEVSVSARLIDLRTGEVLWQGSASRNAKADQRSVPGIVAEMSREVTDTVEALVSSMQERVSTASLSLSRASTQQ
jgi:ABC-type uncharacterized transport system auxiliary subunit